MAKRTVNQWHYIIQGIHDYSILLDSREIFLSNDRDGEDDLGIDHITANRFIKNIRLLETQNSDPIVIHQNTVGGDISNSLAIYDAIVNCKCKVLFICHGDALSGGSLIPQACVKHGDAYRVSMPNCTWMIHQGDRNTGDVTNKQVGALSKLFGGYWTTMLDIYANSAVNGPHFKNLKADEKKVKRFIEGKIDEYEDWYFTAKEAVEYGFVDAVMGDPGYESIDSIFKTWEG